MSFLSDFWDLLNSPADEALEKIYHTPSKQWVAQFAPPSATNLPTVKQTEIVPRKHYIYSTWTSSRHLVQLGAMNYVTSTSTDSRFIGHLNLVKSGLYGNWFGRRCFTVLPYTFLAWHTSLKKLTSILFFLLVREISVRCAGSAKGARSECGRFTG
jgi:hypothetical protein